MSIHNIPTEVIKRIIYFFPENVEGIKSLQQLRAVNKKFLHLINDMSANYLSNLQKLALMPQKKQFSLYPEIENGSENSDKELKIFQTTIIFWSVHQHRVLLDIEKETFARSSWKLSAYEPEAFAATDLGYYNYYSFGNSNSSISFVYKETSQELELIPRSPRNTYSINKEGLLVTGNIFDFQIPIRIFKNEKLISEIPHDASFKTGRYFIKGLQLAHNRLLIFLGDNNLDNNNLFAFYDLNQKALIGKPIELNDPIFSSEIENQLLFSENSIDPSDLSSHGFIWDGADLVLFVVQDAQFNLSKIDIMSGEKTALFQIPYTSKSPFHLALKEKILIFSNENLQTAQVIHLKDGSILKEMTTISFDGAHLEKDKLILFKGPQIHIFSINSSESAPLWVITAQSPIREVKMELDVQAPYILAVLENNQVQTWKIRKHGEPLELIHMEVPESF